MKGMRFALGMAFAGLLVAGAASAQQVQQASGMEQKALQAIVQLQQQMIQKNYQSMLFKPQMMGKYMNERASQNYMQNSIQPVMLQKMRDQIKPLQMQIMQQNVGGSVTTQQN
ncbi:hypothetical protein [Candidatus Electronema sp. PJ]|uniref:hypothetical protein n=1 Tax=Candidatus Electronema sp. PJ TaxID=3401572 RepID=UPI003AA7AD87